MKKLFLLIAVSSLFLVTFGVEQAAARKQNSWGGVWRVASRFTPSSLAIRNVTARSFRFKIDAMNGANMGEVSGVAKIKGNKAIFDDRTSKDKDSRNGCRLTFTHRGTFIDVDATSNCLRYAGNGVYFGNEYYKGKRKVIEDSFVTLEVMPNAALERKFKALVGADYERFLNSFHQISETEDLDGLGAKAFDACVRGMCPWWTGVIMYDKQGNLWAVVLDDSVEDKVFARYYTNAAGWTDKMPKTVAQWLAEKNELNDGKLVIVYKNKK